MQAWDLAHDESYVRLIEMSVDCFGQGRSLQFWSDVNLYGLEEALLYLRNEFPATNETMIELESDIRTFVDLIKADPPAEIPWGLTKGMDLLP